MSNHPLVLALDQGTSSSRAALFTKEGRLIASHSAPLRIEYPADGWVEQDANEIWESQQRAMAGLEKKLTTEQRKSIVSCGIANQRETTILWRRKSGQPCGPALVWQDGRTHNICQDWKQEGLEKEWNHKTGLILDPYFSASKINWLLINQDEAIAAKADGDLCFGTVETWLLWNLTSGEKHYSDMSNASRTLLMDLEKREWVESFCDLIGLPIAALPSLVPCRGDFGRISSGLPFGGVPIHGMLGDQQAATIGQLCLKKGEAKCTYGTGAFLVINTGQTIHRSTSGLLSTLGWTDHKGEATYCLEGSLFNAGTVVQWLRDGLQIIDKSEEINLLAQEVNNSAGVMFVPAFTGWGTPHWDPKARGMIIGLTRDSKKGHIAKAALEGIALSVAGLIQLAEKSLGNRLTDIAVDGGVAASNQLLQAQADCTGINVRRPTSLESTAKGAAIFAGLQAGLINDLEELVAKKDQQVDVFSPQLDSKERERWVHKWDQAVKKSLYWHE